MEMIMIGQSKLKIMLTREDLEAFELEADSLDYNNTETKRMFWDLLGRAKHTVGFDTEGERVLLQLYPSKTGGCELFITKLGKLCPGDSECILEEDPAPTALCGAETIHPPTHLSAFGFDKTEWLLLACRRLLAAGYDQDSSVYVCDNQRLFLLLFDCKPCELLLDEYSFLTEYGRQEDADFLAPYMEEHGKLLCPHDAVEHLGVL